MDHKCSSALLSFLIFVLCEIGFISGQYTTNPISSQSGNPNAGACGRANSYIRCTKGSRELPYLGYCDQDEGLPCTEMFALRTFISRLGLAPAPFISRSYCSETESLSSITIGCTCEGNVCHISEISMSNLRLNGYIHEDLGLLTYLKILNLAFNELEKSIPDNLENLTSLTELHLEDNRLTGPIPKSLGWLKNLTIIHLHLNYLNQTIPPSLGNLTSLRELNLWSNNLSGQIPHELGNLYQLRLLKLDDNELSGELPPELGMLRNLQEITLTSNKLSGRLPKEYAQLRSLLSFEIGGNNLWGTIPSYIAKWDKLTSLILMGNNFEGELPSEIFNMKNLQYLMITDLRSPSFEFPRTANLTNIYSLILRNCSISGVIPSYIGNWSWLKYLDMSFNSLTGEIPVSFQNLTSLSEMFLTGNMLNGIIPGWIFEDVQKGDLSYNNFTFPKPGEKNFHQTRNRGFNNSEHGTFPGHEKINIQPANRETIYQIMDEKCDGKKSKYHSLFINAGGEETIIERNRYDADNDKSNFYISPGNNWACSCSGDFLWSTDSPKDYIKNMTCGVSVPEAPLYAKARLCPQSLTYYGFCLHNGNYTVVLHFAEIVYTEDDDHSSTGKRVFDVYIQGNLALKDFNIKEKAGGPNKIWTENLSANVHDNLLEIRLFWAGKGSLYSAPSPSGTLVSAISVTADFKLGVLSKKEIAGIVIAAISAPLLLLAFMWRMGWLGDRELRVTYVELRGKSYSLKEIRDATRNFSTAIGTGRFGTVYKADLGDQIVAVKKLSPQARHVIDQIGTELYVQAKPLKHDNLVELLGRCSKKSLHLLIYEHMENGSLQRALFDQDSEVQLDWQKRFNICLGIARGMKYLHEDNPNCKIVHRNIKPSNVLLHKSFNAKLADLGLAKIYDEEDPYSFIREKGTAEYMAPEYAMRKAITDKVDVYSFGILLLEIVSGETNVKYEENKETVFLLDTAIVLQKKGKIMELVDKKLSSYNWHQACKILELAMKCIDQSPTERPTMSIIVNELEQTSEVK